MAARKALAMVVAVMALGGCGGDDSTPAAEVPQGAGNDAKPAEVQKVKLLVDFFPGAINGPIFAALGQGFFEDEGLDVSLEFNPTAGATQALVGNKGDIAYTPAVNLLSFGEKSSTKLKAMYAYQRTSPMAILAPAESGITELSDLKGKTVVDFAGSATQFLFPVLMERNGMSKDDVKMRLVDPASRIKSMLAGQADAMLGFWPDNAPLLENVCKCEVNVIKFEDYGIHHLGNGFSTKVDFMAENPDLLKGFFRAVTKGAMFAAENAEQTVADMVGAVGADAAGEKEVGIGTLANLITQYRSPASEAQDLPLGAYAQEDWQDTVDLLTEAGSIKPVADISEIYTNEFVPCYEGSTVSDVKFVDCE